VTPATSWRVPQARPGRYRTPPFEDNDEMIEKVAEAVINYMETKDKFERERRGAFDGSLGG
jgi:hypothetical protein